ncbi:MAG: ferrous iron transport protein A [Acidobacteriota bacterium]
MSQTNSAPPTVRLSDLPFGRSTHVVSVSGDSAITRRLLEMGVIPGVELTVIRSAPFGDPIEVRVRGYSLAMRKTEASTIEVLA